MIYILISHTLGWGASWCMCPDWPPDKKLITGAKQPQDVQAVLTCKSICDVCHFNNIPYQVNIQNAMWIIESAWIVNQMYFRFGLFWSCLVVWSNSFVVERSHWRWQSVSNNFSCHQHQHFDICWFWNLRWGAQHIRNIVSLSITGWLQRALISPNYEISFSQDFQSGGTWATLRLPKHCSQHQK